MRRALPALAACLVLATALAPGAAARAPERWIPYADDARAYALARAGLVAFGVRSGGRFDGLLADATFPSASVVKAMLMVAYLNQPAVRERALTPAERGLLGPMVRWSSNEAATSIRNAIGDGALVRVAGRAGMTRFAPAPSWGSSRITARDQTRFFLRIDRLLPPRHRAYGMGLLRRIVTHQRWGLAQAVPRGWTIYFKGGWGSGSGAVEHQVALLRRGRERVAIAVLTLGNPSAAYGRATQEGIARRLLRGLEAGV
jgi:beta-lactamase class A